MPGKPFRAGTAVSATHCGAGCVLGDLIAEWVVFAAGLQLAGLALAVEYSFDYVLALGWGSCSGTSSSRGAPPGGGGGAESRGQGGLAGVGFQNGG